MALFCLPVACTGDSQCPSSTFCIDGMCDPGCLSGLLPGEGKVCLTDLRTDSIACMTDEECANNVMILGESLCREGFCKPKSQVIGCPDEFFTADSAGGCSLDTCRTNAEGMQECIDSRLVCPSDLSRCAPAPNSDCPNGFEAVTDTTGLVHCRSLGCNTDADCAVVSGDFRCLADNLSTTGKSCLPACIEGCPEGMQCRAATGACVNAPQSNVNDVNGGVGGSSALAQFEADFIGAQSSSPDFVDVDFDSLQAGESPEIVFSFRVEEGDLQAYTYSVCFPSDVSFNIINAGAEIGSYLFLPDVMFLPEFGLPIIALDQTTAYIDKTMDGEYTEGLDVIVKLREGDGKTFIEVLLPFGGDGDSRNPLFGVAGGYNVTIFEGVVKLPAEPMDVIVSIAVTGVDVTSGGPNDGLGLPPQSIELSESFFVEGEDVVDGDLDGDGDVDRNDVAIIIEGRNEPIQEGDDRDRNGDGRINGLDARALVNLCTRPRCAVE